LEALHSPLKTSDFTFDLPPELAVPPSPPRRGDVRLLVLDRETGLIEHREMKDLTRYLRGRSLYVNNSKLVRRWIRLHRAPGHEDFAFMIERVSDRLWLAYLPSVAGNEKSRFWTKEGVPVRVEPSDIRDRWLLRFDKEPDLDRLGHYLTPKGWYPVRELTHDMLAQPLYASVEGSFAAPTAGIHLTREMLSELQVRELTLHTKPGSFYEVKSETPSDHRMEPEFYEIPEPPQGPVVAVGTTVAKALETWARTGEPRGWSDLYIYPPFEFRTVSAFLTNLHRPRESFLLLTSAFGGHERVMEAHREAVREKYRFSYYGDLMLIL